MNLSAFQPPRPRSAQANSPLDRPPPASGRLSWWSGIAAAATHALLAVVAFSLQAVRTEDGAAAAPPTQMFEVALEPAPEPEPEPELEPQAPPARAPRPAPKPVPAPNDPPPAAAEPEEPPPAAARAAEVLTVTPEPAAVVDFGDTFVLGEAQRYAGGVTEAGGTSMRAVRDGRARAHGVLGSRGEASHTADHSRPPSLSGGASWDCPFPREADMAGVDGGVVSLRVSVSAGGSVQRVFVEDDPGYGFGREARRCALRKRWQAGLDRAGSPIRAVARVRVRFMRP